MILVYDSATNSTFDTSGTTGTASINTTGGATGDPCISLSGLIAWNNSPKLITSVDISSITSNDFIRFDYKFVSGTPTECYVVLNNSNTIIYFPTVTSGAWQTKTLPLTPAQITAMGGSLTRFYVQLNNTGAMLIDNIKFMTAADISAIDATVPIITLVGANPLRVLQNATFTDPGATWADNSNTGTVSTITGTVNTAVVGSYTRTYSYSDGVNTGTTTRTVIVDPPYGTPVTTNIYTSESTPTITSTGSGSTTVVTNGGNDGTNCLEFTLAASWTDAPYLNFTSSPKLITQAVAGDYISFDVKKISGAFTEMYLRIGAGTEIFIPNVYSGNWHIGVQHVFTESHIALLNGQITQFTIRVNGIGVVRIDNVKVVAANAAPIDENGTPDPDGSALTHIWANSGEDKVTQDERRLAGGANVVNPCWDGTKVKQWGAKNEIVSVNLIIENNSALYTANGCTVTVSPLLRSGGGTIENTVTATGDGVFNYVGRPIEVFVVEYLKIKGLSMLSYEGEYYDERHVPKALRRPHNPTTGTANAGTTWVDRPNHDKFYPEIATPHELFTNGFRVKPLNNQSIWVDIYIPKSTVAGIYSGTITVKENLGANTAFTVPFELTVENFTLPDVPSSKTMLTLGAEDIGNRHIGVEYPSGLQFAQLENIRATYFKVAHRHKISLISAEVADGGAVYTPKQPSAFSIKMLNGSYFTALNGYDGPGVGVGTGIYSINHYGGGWRTNAQNKVVDPADITWLQTNLPLWETWFKTNLPTVERFFYMVDEPHWSLQTDPQKTDLQIDAIVEQWAIAAKNAIDGVV